MLRYEDFSRSASRVSLDHFDPEGVRELSRTFSKSSAKVEVTSVYSEKSSFPPEEPFSLEKTLRTALDKYARSVFYNPSNPNRSCPTTLIDNMIPVSREGSLVYTSRILTSLVLARQRLTKRRSNRCSTPRSSGRNSESHEDRPRKGFFRTSTVW